MMVVVHGGWIFGERYVAWQRSQFGRGQRVAFRAILHPSWSAPPNRRKGRITIVPLTTNAERTVRCETCTECEVYRIGSNPGSCPNGLGNPFHWDTATPLLKVAQCSQA